MLDLQFIRFKTNRAGLVLSLLRSLLNLLCALRPREIHPCRQPRPPDLHQHLLHPIYRLCIALNHHWYSLKLDLAFSIDFFELILPPSYLLVILPF